MKDRYKHSILDVCETLHGDATGTSDPIPDEKRTELVKWLQWRIETWTLPISEYDDCVHKLVCAALALGPELGPRGGRMKSTELSADETSYLVSLADSIRERRIEQRLSQYQLAKKIGTGRAAIAHIESARTVPSAIMLRRLARALSMDFVID